jgi:hypothetical protein
MSDPSLLLAFIVKAVILLLIVLYVLFSLLMYLNVRKLNSFVLITYSHLDVFIPLLFFLQLTLVVSLFFLALVIL